MFGFKKKDKDKDKAAETKEDRKERRKKGKEKERHNKQERKPVHGELGNILAGSDVEDPKKGRFSFRKSDKRKYDVEHDYDSKNHLPGVEDFAARMGRSESPDTTGSTSPPISGSTFSVSSGSSISGKVQHPSNKPEGEDYRNDAEVSEDGKPVPKPRVRRKKSSSIEIKLQSPRDRNDTNGVDEEERTSGDELVGSHRREESTINTSPTEEFISASPMAGKQASLINGAPPKPPRIQPDRTSGVVEFEVKLINVGAESDRSNELLNRPMDVDGGITAVNTSQSYADAPVDFGCGDTRPKVVLPLRDATSPSILSPSEKTLEEIGVDLKLPDVQPAISGVARVIKLKRRTSGDFGFALRRANAPGSGKTVHFVEPVGPNSAIGLLPGDRLVEVNGINVENEARESIIEMIVMSGDEVVIKVVPVPELSELSVRSGLDGSSVQLDESNLKAGTLARSGSKRIKKKVG